MNKEIEWLSKLWDLFENIPDTMQGRALQWLTSKCADERFKADIAGLRPLLNEAEYDASAKCAKS